MTDLQRFNDENELRLPPALDFVLVNRTERVLANDPPVVKG
jgi:hypothetical protein